MRGTPASRNPKGPAHSTGADPNPAQARAPAMPSGCPLSPPRPPRPPHPAEVIFDPAHAHWKEQPRTPRCQAQGAAGWGAVGTQPGGNLKQGVWLRGRRGCGLWGPSGVSPGGGLVRSKRTHECAGSQGPGPAGRRGRPAGVRGAAHALTCPCSPPPSCPPRALRAGASSDLEAQIRLGWAPLGAMATEPKRHRPNSPSRSGGGTSDLCVTGRSPFQRPQEGCSCLARLPVWPAALGLWLHPQGSAPVTVQLSSVSLSSSSLLVRTPIPGFRDDPTPDRS